MGALRQCGACGVAMGGSAEDCGICGAPYDRSSTDEPASREAALLTAPPPTPGTMVAPQAAPPSPVPVSPVAAPTPEAPIAAAPVPPLSAPATSVGAAPPARPDPYAQIANPLHSNWGTPGVQLPQPQAAPRVPSGGRSRWIKLGVAVLVVVGILGVMWSQRSQLGDMYDNSRERIEDYFDDSDSPQTEAALGTGATRTANEAFIEWEDDNIDELNALVASVQDDIATTNEEDFWRQPPAAVRPVAARISEVMAELVRQVDGAPESQIRSDVLTVYLKIVSMYRNLIAGIDSGQQNHFDEAQRVGEESMADLKRFSAFYGGRTEFFRI